MCVSFCLFFYDDNLNCIRKCFKYFYLYGKYCKNGCLLFFFFINFCYDYDECLEKCDSFKYVIENYICIYYLECIVFIYDDMWCF